VYGPCFSSIVGGHPLRPPTRRRLGRPLPYQLADGTQAPPKADYSFSHRILIPMTTFGISPAFAGLSQTSGQVTNALLTRSPLGNLSYCYKSSSFDLHVLGTPPAFILSQDQTLRKKFTLASGYYEVHWIDGSCCFLSLFSCQGSVNKAGGILLASLSSVKAQTDESADVLFQHRLVRLQNQLACVSDVRRLLSCQRSALGDEICLNVLAKNNYTRIPYFVKENHYQFQNCPQIHPPESRTARIRGLFFYIYSL
jgi:hypothetical protein